MSWYYPKRASKSSAGGIRLHKTPEKGGAGWGRRFLEAISHVTPAKPLARGLRYARSGQVVSIRVDQGFAAAEVQGSRALPYKVELGLSPFTRKQWMRVADALLKKAFLTAKLLAGEMPPEMDGIFRGAGAPLLPASPDEMSSDCSCTEAQVPCPHVAAAYYILAQEMDRDPFMLLEMRGLGRAQLLAEIQTRRGAGGKDAGKTPFAPLPERPAQTLLAGRLNDFFHSPNASTLTWPAEPGDVGRRLKPGGRIQEMGTPPFWQSDNSFEEVLTRIYEAVRRDVLE